MFQYKVKHRMSLRLIPLSFMLLIGHSSLAYAGFYKWTDEQGQVHYSQTPPDHLQPQELQPKIGKTGAEDGISNMQERWDRMNADREDKRIDRLNKNFERKALATRKKNCDISKNNLINLNSGWNKRVMNAQGEAVYISDEERVKRIEAAKKAVQEYCED